MKLNPQKRGIGLP